MRHSRALLLTLACLAVVAATVAGLPRRSVHLIRSGRDGDALVVYGRGLGAVLVFESRADGRSALLHGLKLLTAIDVNPLAAYCQAFGG